MPFQFSSMSFDESDDNRLLGLINVFIVLTMELIFFYQIKSYQEYRYVKQTKAETLW